MVSEKSEIDYFFVSPELAPLKSEIKADDRYGMWPHLAVQLNVQVPGTNEKVITRARLEKYGATRPIGPPLPPPSYQVPLSKLETLQSQVTSRGHAVVPTDMQVQRFNEAFKEYSTCLETELADSPDRDEGMRHHDQDRGDGTGRYTVQERHTEIECISRISSTCLPCAAGVEVRTGTLQASGSPNGGARERRGIG